MAEAEREIPLAEQEAAMPGAPGYARALLAVGVIIFTAVLLFALVWLLMTAISPIESREGKPRPRPAVLVPSTPEPQPEVPIRGLPPPPPAK